MRLGLFAPWQRVHRGWRGHLWFDLDGPALEGLRSAAAGAGWARRTGCRAGEVAADRLQRGDPPTGHEGPVDPGHTQRPATGDQQVRVGRPPRSGAGPARRTPPCARRNSARSGETMARVPR